MSTTQFAQWGHSLALRVPRALAESLSARPGTSAEMTVENGCLIVRPTAPRYTLDGLLAQYDPALHHHPEMPDGGMVGAERLE